MGRDDRTDAELVEAARGGGRAAFGELYERHLDAVERAAARMVGRSETARDLAQEAMLDAYLSLRWLRDTAHFRAWVCGIAANLCRSYLREQHPLDPLDPAAPAGGGDLYREVEARELRREIEEAMEALSPAERAAAALFYLEQLSLKETAEALGTSVGAVKVRLHKGRARLREQLLPTRSELRARLKTRGRKRTMTPVRVADVFEARMGGESQWAVLLLNEAQDRALPIWVGAAEGMAIAAGVRDLASLRPLTLQFTASLLEAAGAVLERVEISALEGKTFLATAHLRSGKTAREVDARPSDAIGLALRTGSPIFVADEVMEKGGIRITEVIRKKLGTGLDQMARKLEEDLYTAYFRYAAS